MGFLDNILGNKDDPVTESTPLNKTASENLQAAPDYLKRQASKLYEMSKEGPLSFRILAFLGGIGMIGAGVYDFVTSIIVFEAMEIVKAIYTMCFGVFICLLEGTIFEMPKDWQRKIKFYFRIIDFTWGRGVAYAFVGSLQLMQPNKINDLVGTYMILIGLVAIVSSISAGQRLAELRILIDNKRDLSRHFHTYDTDNSGALTVQEFAVLLGELGVDVNYQEMYACFNAIDKNDDDRINYDEFKGWWTEWGMKRLHRSMSDLIV